LGRRTNEGDGENGIARASPSVGKEREKAAKSADKGALYPNQAAPNPKPKRAMHFTGTHIIFYKNYPACSLSQNLQYVPLRLSRARVRGYLCLERKKRKRKRKKHDVLLKRQIAG